MPRDPAEQGISRRISARVSSPIAQFAIAGIFAVSVIGAAAAYLLDQAGIEEATRDAERVSILAGEGIVEPLLGPQIAGGKPNSLRRINEVRRIDEAVRNRILGKNGIVRVKIWDADSRIIYSDEQRLIDEQFVLGDEELEILREGGSEAEATDLSQPENRFEPDDVDLVEVYSQVRTSTGEPLLFETYTDSGFISTGGREIWATLAPILIGSLVVLAVLQLPLATSLARRLQRGQREREALLKLAIDASEMERRRIAQDLHDGVVQDLTGVAYSVAAVASRAGAANTGDAQLLGEAASRLRQSTRDLRGLLVEIYPPDLHRSGLATALSDITGGLSARGLKTELGVPEDLELPTEIETLFFRISQEAVRNVVAHAEAENLLIAVTMAAGSARLQIRDDGRGFSPDDADSPGHYGLRMLADLTEEAGGAFELRSEPGRGTEIHVRVDYA